MPDTPNPNILDAMREVEEAAEKATPRPWHLHRNNLDDGHWSVRSDSQRPGEPDWNTTLAKVGARTDGHRDANTEYICLTANHAPGIIAFARRLLAVARVSKRAIDRYKGSVLISERELGALDLLARLERDYPGVLEDGGGE